MAIEDLRQVTCVRIHARSGPYQYLLVRPDGSASTVHVGADSRDEGSAEVDVHPGDRIMEIALKSTSDPDLDPPRGQLWPPEDAA